MQIPQILSVLMLGIASACGQNLIENPSFETLDENQEPLSWVKSQGGADQNFHSLVIDFARTGIRSAKLDSGDQPIKESQMIAWQQNDLQSGLSQCPPGTQMEFSVFARTIDPSVTFRIYIEMKKDGKFIGTYISPSQTVYTGWEKKTVSFEMPATVPDGAYVCLQLLSKGAVWFDDAWLGKVADVPQVKEEPVLKTHCRVTNFPPRHTYYLPSVPTQLTFDWHLPASAEGKVKISLLDGAGKRIKEYPFDHIKNESSKSDASAMTIDLPKLEAGSYSLLMESGVGSDRLIEEELFRIRKDNGKGVRFTDGGRMILDGKPFFPIAVVTPDLTEAAISIYSKAGFNTILFNGMTSNAAVAKFLSGVAAKYNMATVSWSNLGDLYNGNDKAFAETIALNAKVAETIPNFIGWFDDESEHRKVPLEGLKQAYQLVFQLAPDYVFWQNHAPRLTATSGVWNTPENVRKYSQQSDVTGIDVYPLPEGHGHNDLPNRTMSCVGDYTDLVSATVDGRKPTWMILQGMGWSEEGAGTLNAENPRPDYSQLRFMTYNAITHGATGIGFYGPAGLRDIYSPFMATLADVLQELNAVSPFLLSGKNLKTKINGDSTDIRVMAKREGSDVMILAVNESKETRAFTMNLPDFKTNTLYRSPDGTEVAVTDGNIPMNLPANGVSIFSSQKIVVPKHSVFTKPTLVHDPEESGRMERQNWTAQWTAHPQFFNTADKTTFARTTFDLDGFPEKATIRVAADDSFKVKINGIPVGSGNSHLYACQFDIKKMLRKGRNEIVFEVFNVSGPGGLIYEADIQVQGKSRIITSGEATEFSADGKTNWIPPHLAGTPPVDPWGSIPILIKMP